jgi:hypothetical protein
MARGQNADVISCKCHSIGEERREDGRANATTQGTFRRNNEGKDKDNAAIR